MMPDTVEHAPLTDGEGEVFEIFQQDKHVLLHHGGNLRAPDRELAMHYAKEFYGRRQESLKLWIIPRAAIWEIVDTTLPSLPLHALADLDTSKQAGGDDYAVFGQKIAGSPLEWLHDLKAASWLAAAEGALQAMHRSEGTCLRLWVCPRSAITELTNLDLLQPPLDRSYRRLDGYNIRDKLRAARQRVQAQERTPL